MTAVAEPETLDVTIISGLSGAGRSAAGDVLEDLGFFVIDNLPPALIPKITELGRGREAGRFALVVDTRAGEFLSELEAALAELRESGARTRVLFLDASDEVLVRRFDATRRRHPLADSLRVSEGIARERELLEELKGQADVVVDTSELNVHELRDRLRELFGEPGEVMTGLQISVVSFGYKHGLPLDVDLVFDCRFLPNPHWIESLRPLPGTDAKVRRYVMKQEETQEFLEELERLFALLLPAYVREGKSYLSIGVGCTGGNHRSVVIAAEIAKLLERLGFPARVHHRDLERE
jgi:RNase adapter protein RapZ